jgi:hypothetical protein
MYYYYFCLGLSKIDCRQVMRGLERWNKLEALHQTLEYQSTWAGSAARCLIIIIIIIIILSFTFDGKNDNIL